MNRWMLLIVFIGLSLMQAAHADEDTALLRKAQRYFTPLPEAMPGAEQDTPEQIALGMKLFSETRLSINDTQSCSSCHRIESGQAGIDYLPTSIGARGEVGSRNAPTVWNAGWHSAQFWDGRAADLVEQAKGPIVNPIEMGMPDEKSVEEKIRALDEYSDLFSKAFPDTKQPVSYENIARAIAAFERTLRTQDRFDDFLNGNLNALDEQEKRGLASFIGLNCVSCHDGSLLGGELFERLGKDHDYEDQSDLGVYAVTKKDEDKMVFKVSSLRNVALTAPYFHNGKVATLEQAVEKMAWLQLGKKMDKQERDDVVAFLKALNGKSLRY